MAHACQKILAGTAVFTGFIVPWLYKGAPLPSGAHLPGASEQLITPIQTPRRIDFVYRTGPYIDLARILGDALKYSPANSSMTSPTATATQMAAGPSLIQESFTHVTSDKSSPTFGDFMKVFACLCIIYWLFKRYLIEEYFPAVQTPSPPPSLPQARSTEPQPQSDTTSPIPDTAAESGNKDQTAGTMNAPSTSSTSTHTSDASLKEELEDAKAGHEAAMREERQVQAEAPQKHADAMAERDREYDSLKKLLEQLNADRDQALAKKVQIQKESDEEVAKLEAQIKKINSDNQTQAQKLAERVEELEDRTADYEKQIEDETEKRKAEDQETAEKQREYEERIARYDNRISDMIKQHEEKIRDSDAAHAEEIATLNAQHKSALEASRKVIQDQTKIHADEKAELERKLNDYKQEAEDWKREWKVHEGIDTVHEEQVEALEKRHKELEAQAQQSVTKIKELEGKLANSNEQLQDIKEERSKQLAEMKSKHQEELTTVNNQHDSETERASEEHNKQFQEMAKKIEELEGKVTKYEEQIKQNGENWEEEIAKLKAEHEKELASVKLQHGTELEKASKEHNTQFQEATKKQIKQDEEKQTEELAKLKAEHEKKLTSLKAQHEKELKKAAQTSEPPSSRKEASPVENWAQLMTQNGIALSRHAPPVTIPLGQTPPTQYAHVQQPSVTIPGGQFRIPGIPTSHSPSYPFPIMSGNPGLQYPPTISASASSWQNQVAYSPTNISAPLPGVAPTPAYAAQQPFTSTPGLAHQMQSQGWPPQPSTPNYGPNTCTSPQYSPGRKIAQPRTPKSQPQSIRPITPTGDIRNPFLPPAPSPQAPANAPKGPKAMLLEKQKENQAKTPSVSDLKKRYENKGKDCAADKAKVGDTPATTTTSGDDKPAEAIEKKDDAATGVESVKLEDSSALVAAESTPASTCAVETPAETVEKEEEESQED